MKNYNDISAQQSDISRIVELVYGKGYDKAYNDRKIEEEFDEDRAKAINEAYQNGLNDAWECAKLVTLPYLDGGIDYTTLRNIFDKDDWQKVLMDYSASEAIAKIKEYEEKKKADEEKKKADDEIKVGDEVMVDERRMIVLGIDSAGWRHLWCPSTGFVHSNITTSEMTKTNRHFDFEGILDQTKDE